MGLQQLRWKLHPIPPSQSCNDSPLSVACRLTCLKQASRDSSIRLLLINIHSINSDYLSRDDLAPGPVNAQMETLRWNHSSAHEELLGCWAWRSVCCVNIGKLHLRYSPNASLGVSVELVCRCDHGLKSVNYKRGRLF